MRLTGPAFRYLTALGIGLAGGMNLHRLDLEQSATWLEQTATALLVSLSRDVASRILPSKASSGSGASQAAWTEPNSANLLERMSDDLSKRVDNVRAVSESSARELAEGLERIRRSAEQNQRELIARIAQLGERLDRIERRSAGAVVVNRSERQPPAPPARPAVKPVQHPAPPARLKAARTQPPTQIKAHTAALADWTVRNVVDDVAVLVGPLGHMVVGVGDDIPGIGRIDTIKRSGSRWVVATTKGVITSRNPSEPASESTRFW